MPGMGDRVLRTAQQQRVDVRSILTAALTRGGLAQAWVEATEDLRGDEVPLPERSAPRKVDLG